MAVLNAAGVVTPLSSHRNPERRPTPQPRKPFPKLPTAAAQRAVGGSFASIAAFLAGVTPAGGLTYDEALSQSATDNVGDALTFGAANPLAIGGAAIALAVPVILSQILGKGNRRFGVETAKVAYERLREDEEAQLVDVRDGKEVRETGCPNLRAIGKKTLSVVYRGDDKSGFLKKLGLKFKEPQNTTLYILDKFNGDSELVAELVTVNGFKAAYAIKDGADGPRGWKNSELPWSPPKKSLSLDFGDLFSGALGEKTDGLPVSLGLAAAAGLGFLAFAEIETVLQMLGSVGIVQFATKKLLFAEDRKVTLNQIDEFLSKNVAPKELVGEIKMIGKALLPISKSTKASLPAPVEETSNTPLPEPAAPAPTPVKADAESSKEVNSIPKQEIASEPRYGHPRAQSPYPMYPNFKPPSSPIPSQP